jgi:hypothetical protein
MMIVGLAAKDGLDGNADQSLCRFYDEVDEGAVCFGDHASMGQIG